MTSLERWAAVTLALAFVVALAQRLLLYPAFTGDEYIHLVFARNIAEGHWFQFNPGEGSGGSSSPLWTLLLAGVYRSLGEARAIDGAKVLAMVFSLGTIPLLYLVSRRLLESSLLGAVTALLWSTNPMMATWTARALETSLFVMVIFAAGSLWPRVGTPLERWRMFVLGGILGLLPAVRPEGIWFSVTFCSMLILSKGTRAERRWSGSVGVVLLAVLLASGFYLLHAIHTGGMLPSSSSRVLVARGDATHLLGPFYLSWETLRVLLLDYFPLLPLAALGFLSAVRGRRSQSWEHLHWLSWCAGVWGFFIFVFPETHQHRYILPAVPLLYLYAVNGIRALRERLSRRLLLVVCGGAVFSIGAIATIGLIASYQYNVVYLMGYDAPARSGAALWVRDNTAANSSVAAVEIDQMPYISRRELVDLTGIVQPRVRRYLSDRTLVPYLSETRTDYLLFESNLYSQSALWRETDLAALLGDHPLGEVLTLGDLRFEVVHREPYLFPAIGARDRSVTSRVLSVLGIGAAAELERTWWYIFRIHHE